MPHWIRLTAVQVFLAALLLAASASRAEQALFAEHDMLDIELIGSIEKLIRDTDDRKRHALKMRVGDRTIDVEARVRGKSRASVCEFPPLKIYFDDASGTAFEGQDSLKLVTHCYNSKSGDRYVTKEYAAYRIFRVLTDKGYDARLVNVFYNDDDLPKRAQRHVAAFLESDKGLADRIGGDKVKAMKIRKSELDEAHTALVYVFEFLVGNNDWATSHTWDDDKCCHNLDVFRVDDKLVLIPFDFDLSELVDASYAADRPGALLVREPRRRNIVYCVDRELLAGAVDLVVARQDEIAAEIAAIPGACDKDVERMQKEVNRFYRLAQKKDRIPKAIDTRCE